MYRLIILLCVLLFSGCAIGPTYKPYPSLSSISNNLEDKIVIVSDFKGSRHEASSYTGSIGIAIIQESINTVDISPEIATILIKHGIRAEPRKSFTVEMLKPDQVLLNGTMRINGGMTWDVKNIGNWVNFAAMCGSLAIVGMVLPTPIPWTSNVSVSYNVNVLDHEGQYLAYSGDQFLDAVFDNYYFWGILSKSTNPRTYQDFIVVLGNIIAEWFK